MAGYRLFTPGPVDIPQDVIRCLTNRLIYHRSKEFGELFTRVCQSLKQIIATDGDIFFFTSSGTGAMEAAVVNLLTPDEEVLVAICGKFGERWLRLCERYTAKPHCLSMRYGESIPPEKVEELLHAHPRITTVFTTLTETSTGALIDIKTIGTITRKLGKVLVVDGIAGLAADKFYMDEWQVDVAIGASQKAFMSPPGLSFLAINKRTWEKVEKAKLPRFYWDLTTYKKFAADGQTPYTPAINIFFALETGVNKILKRGIDAVYNHHYEIAQQLRSDVKKLNLNLFPKYPSNALTVIEMPKDVDGTRIISYVKEKYCILFANGQAELKGRIVRIGHMGEYSKEDILLAIEAFTDGCEAVGLRKKK